MAHMAPRTFAINPGTLAIPFAYSIGEKREGVFLCLQSSFSCSHDHDHAGEWRRFTGLPIHLIFQTSGQKPDFRTVQDMVLEPAGVSACGNQ